MARVLFALLLSLASASASAVPRGASLASEAIAVGQEVQGGKLGASAAATSYASLIAAAQPTSQPSSLGAYQSAFSQIWNSSAAPPNFVAQVIETIEAGADAVGDIPVLGSSFQSGACPGIDCSANSNAAPRCTIYPQKASSDAPYSVPEATLRAALYIPSTFKYGSNGQPILLVPGTGTFGGSVYAHNFAKLFAQDPNHAADPVWLNVPGALLGDAQLSAEFVAYALNYLQCASGTAVAVLAWSQGNIDVQWALKYWGSTRQHTTDHIAVSPDYHGTVDANALCAALPCDPSVLQQQYTSTFVGVLRNTGGVGPVSGAAAIVPTTTVFSAFDEVVEPQSGPLASGMLLQSNGVPATNNLLQALCPLQPAGGEYGHAGVLINPIAAALAFDALAHDGPGVFARALLKQPGLCAMSVASGLNLADVFATEGQIAAAGTRLVLYSSKSYQEPPIMAYAS